MTIGLPPDAGAGRPAGRRCRTLARRRPDAVKPGIHGVRTPWIRGFMAFLRVRDAGIVMLMVLAWSGGV
jgi:hypothetical protein